MSFLRRRWLEQPLPETSPDLYWIQKMQPSKMISITTLGKLIAVLRGAILIVIFLKDWVGNKIGWVLASFLVSLAVRKYPNCPPLCDSWISSVV